MRQQACECGDQRYHCAYGFHHVVPWLAENCSGVSHGLVEQRPELKAAG